MNTYTQTVFNQVKAAFVGQQLDTTTVFNFIRICMDNVSAYDSLAGLQKKELVIAVLQMAIDSMVTDPNEQQLLNFMIQNFISTIIDQFCDIDANGISLNPATKSKIKAFFSKLFPCCCPTTVPAPVVPAPVIVVPEPVVAPAVSN